MSDVQALFEQFHKTIRTNFGSNAVLKEKKDKIVDRVQKHLKERDRPSMSVLLQGSYAMRVGILPVPGGEVDIDVGLMFDVQPEEYTPEEVRSWVLEAVKGHTENVREKRPCIRVSYADKYHVDLVCYASWKDAREKLNYRLAHKTDGWRPADPPGLLSYVETTRKTFAGSEDSATKTDQFRRVVRYLKRWNDHALPEEGRDKPSGLALLILTSQVLRGPVRNWSGSNDLEAVRLIASHATTQPGRVSANKPTPEYEDLFAELSSEGMESLKTRFGELEETCDLASSTEDVSVACNALKSVFGPDFPCPEGSEGKEGKGTLETSAPAIVPSSSSAVIASQGRR